MVPGAPAIAKNPPPPVNESDQYPGAAPGVAMVPPNGVKLSVPLVTWPVARTADPNVPPVTVQDIPVREAA